jgi:AcrR family transcriptional regulator
VEDFSKKITEPVEIRTVPVQQRSNNRMQALLDAAAAIIEEEGVDAVTTTAVAYRSRSSVGVLYRYFPNIDSLLKALAQRNMQRYFELVQEGIDKAPSDIPWSSFDNTLDSYVYMFRHEPGFRGLRFGDIISDRFLDAHLSNNSVIARAFAQQHSETHALPVTDDILFHLEVAVAMATAIIHRAFLYDPRGDERYIEHARDFIGNYLRGYLPINAQR